MAKRTKRTFTTGQNTLIASAVAKGGLDALKQIPPLAFSARLLPGIDPADPAAFLEPCVELTPAVNPLFDAVMMRVGATPRGIRTWEIGTGPKASPVAMQAVLEAIPGVICFTVDRWQVAEKRGHIGSARSYCASELTTLVNATDAGSRITLGLWHHFYGGRANQPDSGPLQDAAIVLSFGKGRMFVQLVTTYGPKRELLLAPGLPDLNLFRRDARRDPVRVTADVAITVLEKAAAKGHPVLDPTGDLRAMRSALCRMVVAQRLPGAPAQARLVVGREVPVMGSGAGADHTAEVSVVEATEVASLTAMAAAGGVGVAVAPQIADTARMTRAAATGTRPGLRPYQDEAVSLHLSTTIGYVNASSVGLGKTVMTLSAYREKARMAPRFRAVVVVKASLISQWVSETHEFFPEAHVSAPAARNLGDTLASADAEAGDEPLVVIISRETARTCVDDLCTRAWDEVCCDEAAILSNTGSGRTKALWLLRQHAQVAVALTGTPIEKGLDDLGRILAWTRNEEAMFYGERLSKRFDVTEAGQVEALWKAIGPTVFRRDRSEIADELPSISTETVLLDPHPAELALADGARHELRRIYDDLAERIEAARALDPSDPSLATAQAELRSARGAVLGGVTLARMAACDPIAVAGSDSAGAMLLDQAGLVAPAARTGGTKRMQIAGLVAELADRGEAILIFTDFAKICDHLADDLRAQGVRVGVYSGHVGAKRREADKQAFMAGDLDCLVLTESGNEGLNLQRASVLVHFDLPWLPSKVVQRVGRATRIGSTADHLQILIPIMAGTIEERVAAVLVPRAVEALAVLDTHRGIKGSETELGLALNGIAEAVSESEREGKESVFALAAEILAA